MSDMVADECSCHLSLLLRVRYALEDISIGGNKTYTQPYSVPGGSIRRQITSTDSMKPTHRFKRLNPILQNSSGQVLFHPFAHPIQKEVEQLPCRRRSACNDEILCLLSCRNEVTVTVDVSVTSVGCYCLLR